MVEQKGHSGFGIASLALALAVGAGDFLIIFVAAVWEASTVGGIDVDSPEAVAVGLLICAGLLVNLLGMALGVVGLVQRDRQRLFPVLGLTLNGLTALGIVAMVVIGNLIS